jgi:hypothetical protein
MCVPYGSIENYRNSTNDLACMSGYLMQNSSFSFCIPTPQIVNRASFDFKCSSPLDSCIYESKPILEVEKDQPIYRFEFQCECGLNSNGDSYCPNIYSPSYTSRLYDITTRFASNCHTKERFATESCYLQNAQSASDMEMIHTLIVQRYERDYNQMVRNNDGCVKQSL